MRGVGTGRPRRELLAYSVFELVAAVFWPVSA